MLYYLQIYFQAVYNVSAAQSGVRNLPFILSSTLATNFSGGLITVFGHFVPFMIRGSTLATIGCGLLYTFSTHSSPAQWIGYQILAEFGIGLAFQVSIISARATAAPTDLSSITAMVLCKSQRVPVPLYRHALPTPSARIKLTYLLVFQVIGGAFFVSAGEVALSNVLLGKLPITAPSVKPQTVVATGVTELRSTFPADTIPGIIAAFMDGLKVAYAIAIASAGIALFISFASKWRKLHQVTGGGAV